MFQLQLGSRKDPAGINAKIDELLEHVEKIERKAGRGLNTEDEDFRIRESIDRTMTLDEMRVAYARCYHRLMWAQLSFFQSRSLRLLSNVLLVLRTGEVEEEGERETHWNERISIINRLINIFMDCKEKYQG